MKGVLFLYNRIEAYAYENACLLQIPYGQKQGLSTRVSMKRAIQQMGFSASGKKETEAILWGSSERAKLTEILNNHNIVRQVVGAFHDHTQALLNTLIDRIEVHEPEDVDGEFIQKLDVYYKFVGRLD